MRRLASLPLAALCALGSLTLTQVATAATSFGSNLIVNGDAEADTGSLSGDSIGPVTGFTLSGDFTVIQYAAGGGYPAATDPGPIDRGANFFGGGVAASSAGQQLISISDVSTTIDAGLATYDLSAYLGGYLTQGDNATLSIGFLDSTSASLGTASIGPVTNTDRDNQTGLSFREASGAVPLGTRSILVGLQLTRFEGSANDGYADNLSLVLAAGSPPIPTAVPEPQTSALMLAGLGALGVAARRRLKVRD